MKGIKQAIIFCESKDGSLKQKLHAISDQQDDEITYLMVIRIEIRSSCDPLESPTIHLVQQIKDEYCKPVVQSNDKKY